LRVLVITDAELAAPRSVEEVVGAALAAGAGAVQLRRKDAPARELLAEARALRSMTRTAGALLFVNDRVDVALAAEADGAHVGPTDLPLASLRRWVPSTFLLGYSTDDPDEARRAEAAGADYLGCGAVYRTRSKDFGDEAIGPTGLDRVARAVGIPVVGIGGITPERASELAATAAAGVAVIGAIMAADDTGGAVRGLLRAYQARDGKETGA
jgi:thiamine-phosphate pyrophosphorylase